jgi:hypothetical protein
LFVQVASLEPCSHAYSFWEGVPLSGKQAFGRLFRQAKTMKVSSSALCLCLAWLHSQLMIVDN